MAGSFSPNIRASLPNARRLAGTPVFRVVVDKASIDQAKAKVVAACRAEAPVLALRLAERAVDTVSRLEAAAGHPKLATHWTHTGPRQTAQGVEVDVYNDIEGKTFKVKSNAPNGKYSGTIKGESILQILLNGAKAHAITPTNAKHLQFPIVRGEKKSFFAGASSTEFSILPGKGKGPINFVGQTSGEGYGVSRFVNQKSPNRMAWLDRVDHPGVVGSALLQIAKAEIDQIAEGEGAAAGRRIAARVG